MSEPQKIAVLSPDELEALLERAVARAQTNGTQDGDRLLDADEAAAMLSVSPDWLYKNWHKLPFAVKLHRKMLRFSYQGIQRYIAAKRTG